MKLNRTAFVIVFGILFVFGAAYIVYAGRPVMKIQPEQQAPVATPSAVTPTTTPDVTVATTGSVATSAAVARDTKTSATTSSPQAPTPAPTPEPTKPSGMYTMADVQSHATPADCWSAINGSVYDLTTWVSRHPGGPGPIQGLCGADGSDKFNRKHGTAQRQQAALILLKIGTLQ